MSTPTTPLAERHGHDVIEMMLESGKTYSRESLKQEIIDTFGIATTFYTCSSSGMTPDQLIDFLDARGKFKGTDDAFIFDPEKKCNH